MDDVPVVFRPHFLSGSMQFRCNRPDHCWVRACIPTKNLLYFLWSSPGSSVDRTPPCGGGGQRFKSSPGCHCQGPSRDGLFLSARLMEIDLLQLPTDQFLTCRHCHISFVWTGWEQVHSAQQPELCPGCRYLLDRAPRWGVVKWFDARKGFGFITASDGSDIYVRRKDLKRTRSLRAGQWVSFRVRKGEKGIRAIDVRVRNST